MSLEQALAENTAVMKELVAAWKALTANAAACKTADTVKAGGVKVLEKAADPKPAPTPTAPVTATPVSVVETAQAEAVAESPSDAPTVVEMKDLSAAVTAAATRNRDGLVALLGKHKVKRASEVPQDQWAALVVELEAL